VCCTRTARSKSMRSARIAGASNTGSRAGGSDMRAHQPGSTPIDIPETIPNPAYTPTPAPERAPTKVPEKVPEKVIAPESFGAFFAHTAACYQVPSVRIQLGSLGNLLASWCGAAWGVGACCWDACATFGNVLCRLSPQSPLAISSALIFKLSHHAASSPA
jgi:hypothetical protein